MNNDLFPEELAQAEAEHPLEKYRPSNGTEGEWFMSRFCFQCAEFDPKFGCLIQAKTMLYPPDDPNYPPEWVYTRTGEPTCTAYHDS